jgi:hypothetical protein
VTKSVILDEVVISAVGKRSAADQALALNNALGTGLIAKEGLLKGAATLDRTLESSKAFSGMVKATRYMGTAIGGISAASSVYNYIQSPTIANGFKASVNVALLFAGPAAGLVGGVLEATGVEDMAAQSLQSYADELLLKQQ